MDNTEFVQLNNAITTSTKFIEKQRVRYFDTDESIDAIQRIALNYYRKDAEHVARMVSQAIDSEDLTVAQQIALKASLSQLEFELRLLQDH